MGTRDSYDHGIFSWVELATTDRDAARAFYERLFGWTYEDRPAGDGTYTIAQRDGAAVAGVADAHGGEPPNWRSYVTVDDVDGVTAKVEDLGGTVDAGPFDVMDAGRASVVQDPAGAYLCLWQAKDMPGARLVNAHGAFSWNDLATTDVEQASAFYSELLGWEIGAVEDAPDDRAAIKVGDRMNGGMAKVPQEGVTPHWLVFFGCEDLDAARAAVEEGGGQVMAGPLDIPAGRMLVATDPAGAPFGLFSGDLDD